MSTNGVWFGGGTFRVLRDTQCQRLQKWRVGRDCILMKALQEAVPAVIEETIQRGLLLKLDKGSNELGLYINVGIVEPVIAVIARSGALGTFVET